MNKKAIFSAGCFWGVEDLFRKTKGVIGVRSGYTGGHLANPSYEDVCTGKTGHAEAVEVIYDSELISYEALLDAFWKMHDPTQMNRQGPDVGEQYRSAIFYLDDEQKHLAEESKRSLESSGQYDKSIATEIVQAGPFYEAEEYHQRYFEKHGGGSCHV